jgi:hypothetical protein
VPRMPRRYPDKVAVTIPMWKPQVRQKPYVSSFNRGTQGLADKLADELANEIRACEPAGGQPIESCAPFQVNSNFEGPG